VNHPGSFARNEHCKNFYFELPSEMLLDKIISTRLKNPGVGKIDNIIAQRGDQSKETGKNLAGEDVIFEFLKMDLFSYIFVNLVDSDA